MRQILGMLKEGEEQNRKAAEEEARLKALLAQQERVDEEIRALQEAREARKGAQAQDPKKEKQEKKAKKSKGGGSRKDR